VLVCGKDMVGRVSDFDQRAQSLTLRPWQWEFLLSLDGRTVLFDIARRMGLEIEIITEAVRFFHEQGLIVVRAVNLEEYRRKMGILDGRPKAEDASEEPFAALEEAPLFVAQEEVVAPPPPAPAMVSGGGVSFSLKPPPLAPPPAPTPASVGTIGFKVK
jgi:hypothetical protein